MKNHQLSLVIPCYNEEAHLSAIVDAVLALRSDTLDVEPVIVDDCSTDGSLGVARRLAEKHPEIKVVTHSVNQGKGAALRTGFQAATGDFVGVQDADMEYDPKDYLTMLEPLHRGEADVVFGSRYLKRGTRQVHTWWHTAMNHFLTTASNVFTDLDLTDMETCYKLFRREVIQEIAPQLKENRFGFEPEVTSLVAHGHYRLCECAIRYYPRNYDEGKKIGWKDGVRALYCIFHYNACRAPLPLQLLIYFFIGAAAAAANIVLFALLRESLPLWGGVAIAFAAAAVLNYFLCIAILFRHKACWSTAGEILAYLVTLVVMFGVDCGVTVLLIGAGLPDVGAKSIAAVIGFAGNFVFRRYLVFPNRKKKHEISSGAVEK